MSHLRNAACDHICCADAPTRRAAQRANYALRMQTLKADAIEAAVLAGTAGDLRVKNEDESAAEYLAYVRGEVAAGRAGDVEEPVEQKQYRERNPARSELIGAVTDERGWVTELHRNPRALAARELAASSIGPELRDSRGRIQWYRVTDPKLKATRRYVDSTDEGFVRIQPGLLHADGTIDKEMLSAKTPAQRFALHRLIQEATA